MSNYAQIPLGEVCSIVGGGTPRRSNVEYFGGSIPWATPTDVTALDSLYIKQTKETITETGLRKSSARLVPAGTVLMTSRATIGSTAIATVPMATNQGFANLTCSEQVIPEFLAYWLRHMRKILIQLSGGTTFRELPKSTLKKVVIPLPALDEQRRIVGILNRAAKIERLRTQAADRLREFIPALFVKMFGDPAENLMGWGIQTVSIGELCDLINGRAFKPTDWVDTGIPIVRIQNLRDPSKPMNKFDGEVKDRFLIDSGDVLLSWSGTPGTSFGCFIWDRGRAILNQHIFRVEYDSSRIERDFFLYAMNSRLDEMIDRAHGGVGLRHITKSELNKIKLPVPPLDEQQRFTKFVEAAHTASTLEMSGSCVAGKLTASLMSRLLR